MNKTMEKQTKIQYSVSEKIIETPRVTTLKLKPVNSTDTIYIAGQYITIYFPETGSPEGKAYSFSSSPLEKSLSITVKAMGEFSNRLTNLQVGDVVTASLPYGYFYSESEDTDMVMIAAGIGVSPFRSIIVTTLLKNPARKITLYYSAKTEVDFAFKKEFEKLQEMHNNFKVIHFVTQEERATGETQKGRIDAQKVLDTVGDTTNSEFFVCGPISFTRDIWRGLRSLGIPEGVIYTEAFFSHGGGGK